MDNKAAIKIAKEYVADVFADEKIQDIALEEIRRDKRTIWEITIGFNRPIFGVGQQRLSNEVASALLGPHASVPVRRSFKRVKIRDTDGEVLGMSEAEWA